nr:odorant receptor 63a-like [Onthophagus taurus]
MYFSTHVILLLKMSVAICYREEFIAAMKEFISIKGIFGRFHGNHKSILKMGEKRNKTIIWSYTSMINSYIVITTVAKIIKLFLTDEDDIINGRVVYKEILYFFTPIPENPSKSLCILISAWHTFAMYFLTLQVLALDSLFMSMTIYLTMLAKVIDKGIVSIGIEEASLTLIDDDRKAKLQNKLRSITVPLQRLLTLAKNVDRIFRYMCFPQVTLTLFSLMTTLFTVVTAELFSPAFFAQLQLYIILLVQLSVYCIFGHMVTVSFSEIPVSLYDTPWYASSPLFRRMIFMNLLRLNEPVYITVGKFTPLSLQLIGMVVRLSYSCFTLLRE